MMACVGPTPRLLRFGDDAVLIEVDGLEQVLDLRSALESVRPEGVSDVIPAARTVLVQFDTEIVGYEQISRWIRGATVHRAEDTDEPDEVTVPVRYDGVDLADVARMCGLTAADVVAQHCGSTYTVAFCGFAPGFAYLVGSPAVLRVPRRSSPRTMVPAGSVGLADTFTGIYPAASPGGWQLIGTTDLELFDIHRDPPALLTPGTRVRFVPQPMTSGR